MKALRIYAGRTARQHIIKNGLQPQDVGVIPGAAGGPKGLILGPLDRFIFGHWLTQSTQSVHLVGASIGAWRMATACLDAPVAAFGRLEHDYIGQHYTPAPGQKRLTASAVSARFGKSLADFYSGRIDQVLNHRRYKLHIIAARGRHLLAREHPVATPLGYAGAFLTNMVHRKALGAWLERVVFSSQCAPLPFAVADYRTRQMALTGANFQAALQASCSIPFALRSVSHIPGAPPGSYWDGGITDYHMHLNYATNLVATNDPTTCRGGINDSQTGQPVGALVLYPHFQQAVVPGWLDKALKWRHRATPYLDTMVLLAPDPAWVKTLPNGKLPCRRDFAHYAADLPGRVKAWRAATSQAGQLADEYAQWLHAPDMGQVSAL